MPDKKESASIADDKGLKTVFVFALYLVFSVLIRLPWFFKDVIDWDESVFILSGQSVADGYLPYTQIWEIKPPLGLVSFAVPILIWPDSLAFIRLFGALGVAVSALAIFMISKRLMPNVYAVCAGLLCIVATSLLIPSAMAVMMEHIALVPLLFAIVLWMVEQKGRALLLFMGALLSMATMARTNLGLAAVICTLAILFDTRSGAIKQRLVSTLWVIAGGATVLLLVFAPYAVSGQSDLFIRSAILAPLTYSSTSASYGDYGASYADIAWALIGEAFPPLSRSLIDEPIAVLNWFFWGGGVLGLLWMLLRRWPERQKRDAVFVAVTTAAVALSMVMSGRPWGHYLIQVAPFFALGAAFLISVPKQRALRVGVGATALLLVVNALPPYSHYDRLYGAYQRDEGLYSGASFELAAYLNSNSKDSDSLFLVKDNLVYWLTHRVPLLPLAAFPGNILAENEILKPLYGPNATTELVLENILCRAPTFIVGPMDWVEHLADRSPAFRRALAEDYREEAVVAERAIYRRRQELAPATSCPDL